MKPKIPLPWVNDPLPNRGEQTLVYWQLAKAWNGTAYRNMTIQGAFEASNKVLNELDPHSPLAFKIRTLKDNIVEYGTKGCMLRHTKENNTRKRNHIHVYVL